MQRLTRNRGNARGPTRLTNPLRRPVSWARAFALLPSHKPSLTVQFLFLLPSVAPRVKAPFLSSTFRHSTHILLLRDLLVSLLPPPCPLVLSSGALPFVFHSPRVPPRVHGAFFPPFPFPQSTHHRIHLPLLLRPFLPLLLFCLCPPPPRSSISPPLASIARDPSLPLLPRPPLRFEHYGIPILTLQTRDRNFSVFLPILVILTFYLQY